MLKQYTNGKNMLCSLMFFQMFELIMKVKVIDDWQKYFSQTDYVDLNICAKTGAFRSHRFEIIISNNKFLKSLALKIDNNIAHFTANRQSNLLS